VEGLGHHHHTYEQWRFCVLDYMLIVSDWERLFFFRGLIGQKRLKLFGLTPSSVTVTDLQRLGCEILMWLKVWLAR
jgi:hypothetical protein